MTRRERIRQGMGATGGTSVPNGRRSQIKAALGEGRPRPSQGRSALPGNVKPMRFPQVGDQPRAGAPLAPPVKLGAQLQGRVQSGSLQGGQAQKVARQRQLLQKALGSDWRTKVFGQGGAKGINGPFAQRQVAAKRAAGLERAKRKLY